MYLRTLEGDYNFNSRPCERGFNLCGRSSMCIPISIHAPARGASVAFSKPSTPTQDSIHAPARGASNYDVESVSIEEFQFTPLREGLRRDGKPIIWPEPFQFTPLREGLPAYLLKQYGWGTISIHAPARGASHVLFTKLAMQQFQFTPLREGLLHPKYQTLLTSISIHAPARGASVQRKERLFSRKFQFTPLREGLRYPSYLPTL